MKLLKRIKNWISKTTERSPSFLEIQYEIEKSSYGWRQEASDREVERCARREALEMFEHYLSQKGKAELFKWANPNQKFNPYSFNMFIVKSQCSIIKVYPGQVSKFDKQGSYSLLVNKLFKEMKEDYENNKTRN